MLQASCTSPFGFPRKLTDISIPSNPRRQVNFEDYPEILLTLQSLDPALAQHEHQIGMPFMRQNLAPRLLDQTARRS
jgi:hypothetical protein